MDPADSPNPANLATVATTSAVPIAVALTANVTPANARYVTTAQIKPAAITVMMTGNIYIPIYLLHYLQIFI